MNFHEHAVHTRSHGSPRQHGDELRLAAAHRPIIFIAVGG